MTHALDGRIPLGEPTSGAGGTARRTWRRHARTVLIGITEHPYVITLALVGLLTVLGINGADWPAQIFRAWLVRDHGAVLWNNQWYGGHLLPGYSVITPVLAGGIGTRLLTAISCVAAAWAFSRLRLGRGDLARRVGSCWFAVIVSIEYLIGRTPFVLGVAAGLMAILAARTGHRAWAAVAAGFCGLASPLAAAFLLMIALAWVPSERVWATRFSLSPAVLGLVMSLVFPGGGDFAFPLWRFAAILGFAGVGLALLPRTEVSARRFLWLYALSSTVLFLIPSAVGGNVARLGELCAGPLMAVVLLSLGRRRLVVLLAVPLLAWQFSSAGKAVAFNNQDSTGKNSAYYVGMLDFLERANLPVGRIEIPFTRGHWETVYVAEHMPLARGWERQLDRAHNSVLYGPGLDEAQYHAWVRETGVRFIALPDVPLDPSAKREAEILRAGADWLVPVWSDPHWVIWEVADPVPLLDGPGQLVDITPSGFTLLAQQAGTFTVRIHRTSWFVANKPNTSIGETEDGWTEVTVTEPGEVTITAKASAVLP
ncbi:hypothetical protein B4N89_07020 [Embleya scabrispora]|uniref:Uncharacterized protein n=1 Tax=Embleya scabrispora TaxID=159449 RepID=A0A1T3NVQ7_9ACTN|nr:hypothetical protein [Embleya scabrispora]OPC80740.1 hypothetical protein B4N89_07020 [Embleya scabrispora]